MSQDNPHHEKDKNNKEKDSSNEKEKSQGLAKSVGQCIDSKDLNSINPDKITRFYKVPSARFKSEDEIVDYYGYKLGNKIAEGGFGVIFSATHTKTKIEVACKKIDIAKKKAEVSTRFPCFLFNFENPDPYSYVYTKTGKYAKPDSSALEDMKNELFILKKLRNPYIVKLYAHFVCNNHLFIFMKLANGGNFSKHVKEKGVLTERESQIFFGQILCAIEYMHSLNIAHRDIKLENVLLLKHPNQKLTVLITDFGLSRLITVDSGQVILSKTICGTPCYMSPELLQCKPFNAFQADVWALGVTLYVMLNSIMPFTESDQKEQLDQQLKKAWKMTDHIAEEPTDGLISILKMMLEPDPALRIQMPQLINHQWISEEFQYSKHYFTPRKG